MNYSNVPPGEIARRLRKQGGRCLPLLSLFPPRESPQPIEPSLLVYLALSYTLSLPPYVVLLLFFLLNYHPSVHCSKLFDRAFARYIHSRDLVYYSTFV